MIDPSLYRREPLKRSSKPLARTRLPRQRRIKGTSLRERPIGVIPLQVRQAVKLRDNDHCQRCKRWAPNGDCHHRVLRSQGGQETLENLVLLCRRCHDEIHANRKQAVKDGWIIPVMNRDAQDAPR